MRNSRWQRIKSVWEWGRKSVGDEVNAAERRTGGGRATREFGRVKEGGRQGQ